MNTEVPKKRRGRPPGKTGPRPGSRPFILVSLVINESVLFAVPAGKPLARHMQQIATDIQRNGLSSKVKQELFICIQPTTREVVDAIRVTRVCE